MLQRRPPAATAAPADPIITATGPVDEQVLDSPATAPAPFNPKTFKFLPQLLRERGELFIQPLEEVTMTLFGTPGTGKTTLAAGRPGTMFMATEPGTEFLDVPSEDVRSWGKFCDMVEELAELKAAGQMPYQSVAIDIIDNLAGYCLEAVCGAKKLDYPPENDFGKTWKQIRVQWETWMRRLMDTVNVTYLSHCATEKVEVQGKVGMKEVDKWVPTFRGNKQAQYLDGVVHAVGYVHKSADGLYVVSFDNTPTCGAKDRTQMLSGGAIDITARSPAEAWAKLSEAYRAKAEGAGYKLKSRWA